MGPGSTPIVLRLGSEAVVISGNGVVFRVRDGKMLGTINDAEVIHSYFDMAGSGDVYVCASKSKGIVATRLSIDGDTLKQKQLWNTKDKHDANFGNWESGANVSIHDGRVLVTPGKIENPHSGPRPESGGLINDGKPFKTLPPSVTNTHVRKTSGRSNTRYRSLAVHDTATLKQTLGKGLLIGPPATARSRTATSSSSVGPNWTGYTKVSAWATVSSFAPTTTSGIGDPGPIQCARPIGD